MKRLSMALENSNEAKYVKASLIPDEEEAITLAVLKRLQLSFSIDTVERPLFRFYLKSDRFSIELELRTRNEISQQIEWEPFKEIAESFLGSDSGALRLVIDQEDGFLEIQLQQN